MYASLQQALPGDRQIGKNKIKHAIMPDIKNIKTAIAIMETNSVY
jgi:hypothetical protein